MYLTHLLATVWAPCATFGPLFLVIPPRSPRLAGLVRGLGVAMTVIALSGAWLLIHELKSETHRLTVRVDQLETADAGKDSAP